MSAEDFLDTNIFVYMFDGSDDYKRQRAEELVQRSLARGTGCISYQVVQETLNVATRKLGFAGDDSRTLLTRILAPSGLCIRARPCTSEASRCAAGTGSASTTPSSSPAPLSRAAPASTPRTCSTASGSSP